MHVSRSRDLSRQRRRRLGSAASSRAPINRSVPLRSTTVVTVGSAFPGGDVPIERGVCTDVIVRRLSECRTRPAASREPGHVWKFSRRTRRCGVCRNLMPTSTIAAVPNLAVFFKRKGRSLPISTRAGDYQRRRYRHVAARFRRPSYRPSVADRLTRWTAARHPQHWRRSSGRGRALFLRDHRPLSIRPVTLPGQSIDDFRSLLRTERRDRLPQHAAAAELERQHRGDAPRAQLAVEDRRRGQQRSRAVDERVDDLSRRRRRSSAGRAARTA